MFRHTSPCGLFILGLWLSSVPFSLVSCLVFAELTHCTKAFSKHLYFLTVYVLMDVHTWGEVLWSFYLLPLYSPWPVFWLSKEITLIPPKCPLSSFHCSRHMDGGVTVHHNGLFTSYLRVMPAFCFVHSPIWPQLEVQTKNARGTSFTLGKATDEWNICQCPAEIQVQTSENQMIGSILSFPMIGK